MLLAILVGDNVSPGISDDAVLLMANGLHAIVITQDKDFGELVFRQNRVTNGILLIRLPGYSADDRAQLVCSVIKEHANSFEGAFSVLSAQCLRVRKV